MEISHDISEGQTKSLFRKFAEAKICAATNKLMSNEIKQQINTERSQKCELKWS